MRSSGFGFSGHSHCHFQMFMYNGYSTYDSEIQRQIVCHSPLSGSVPLAVAEDIAEPYVKFIRESIRGNRTSALTTDKDFKWALEIFAFSFTSEKGSLYTQTAEIYIEWLKVLIVSPTLPNTVPAVLREKTEFYWSQMFWHLFHLFVVHDGKTIVDREKGNDSSL